MSSRWKIAQAAEIRWWKWYLAGKEETAYLDWKKQYWQTFWEKLPNRPDVGASVLDAGCGPAGINMIMEQYQVTAIDPLLEQYQEQIEHFRPASFPWVDYRMQRLEELDAPATFDWIFCLNVINHVADLDRSIQQLWSSLRPGGTMVVSVDAHRYPWFKALLRALPTDILHPHQYDLEEYQKMLSPSDGRLIASYLYKAERWFNYHILLIKKSSNATSTH
ncbi:MAG: methyltransferase domain-containing protein [Bacteroidota bacterium]